MTVPWWLLELIACIGLVFIAWYVYKTVKNNPKERKKIITVWAITLMVGVGVFVLVSLNRDMIMAKYFPDYGYTNNASMDFPSPF